jgi:drug/metabolite transporter (DMT)-like permease
VTESTAKAGRVDMPATAACLGALCCWSVGPILIAQLTYHLDSWTQNALRYTVACLFWLPVLLYFMHQGKFDKRTWRRAALPALANVAMQSLWAATFYYIGPAFTVLLSKTSVLWVAAFSFIFFADERVLARSRRFWAGLALSLTGVFGVLYFKENFAAARTFTGIVLALICAFMWGAYAIAVKVSLRDIDSRVGFAVISIYTVIGLWIGAMVRGEPSACVVMGVGPWMAVVFSAITGIALGHVFFYTAIKRIGATIPSLLILVQPLTVFSISSLVFRGRLNGLQALFGLVLLGGAALSVWAQEHLRVPPQEGGRAP